MKVWAIFSIEGAVEHSTPVAKVNNLEILYEHKPNYKQKMEFLFDISQVEELSERQRFLLGAFVMNDEVLLGRTEYRLEEITLGKRIPMMFLR